MELGRECAPEAKAGHAKHARIRTQHHVSCMLHMSEQFATKHLVEQHENVAQGVTDRGTSRQTRTSISPQEPANEKSNHSGKERTTAGERAQPTAGKKSNDNSRQRRRSEPKRTRSMSRHSHLRRTCQQNTTGTALERGCNQSL